MINSVFKFMRSLFAIFTLTLLGCSSNEEISPNPLSEFEGGWIVELATLDSKLEMGWNETAFQIFMVDDSTLEINCVNQPAKRESIWPSITRLKVDRNSTSSTEDGEIALIRNDEINIRISSTETNEFLVFFHPPRSWSYEEECPNDELSIACSLEGMWNFSLTKKLNNE